MKKICCILMAIVIIFLVQGNVNAYGSQSFSGYGDDIIEIPSIEDGYAFKIDGNISESHFAVKAHDAKGNYLELLVNTTDRYKGITLDPSLTTRILEVTAKGNWKIELIPLWQLDTISTGSTYYGKGDSVLLVTSSGLTASITGNSEEAHFAVRSYGKTGTELLVNTVDHYSGKVMLRNDPFILEVKAEGSWTIKLN